MNVLVAVNDYPDNKGNVGASFVHVRNLYYLKHGINVIVLDFKASEDYVIDNIEVYTYKNYVDLNIQADILIVHSANIKNH